MRRLPHWRNSLERRRPMSEEPLTLSELQQAKGVLETKAHRLREQLRNLHYSRTEGWQEMFSQVQSELVRVATRIGQLERRVSAAVEGEAKLWEEANGGG